MAPLKETRDAVRLSVNITPEVAEAIQALARSRGITVSELVRSALATEKFLADEQRKNKKLLLEAEDGTRERVVFR
ncbi:MAG: ribbon-helix-helix protein, CopG family [Thermomicrobiales bacterium]